MEISVDRTYVHDRWRPVTTTATSCTRACRAPTRPTRPCTPPARSTRTRPPPLPRWKHGSPASSPLPLRAPRATALFLFAIACTGTESAARTREPGHDPDLHPDPDTDPDLHPDPDTDPDPRGTGATVAGEPRVGSAGVVHPGRNAALSTGPIPGASSCPSSAERPRRCPRWTSGGYARTPTSSAR